jgi:hypothetical protein
MGEPSIRGCFKKFRANNKVSSDCRDFVSITGQPLLLLPLKVMGHHSSKPSLAHRGCVVFGANTPWRKARPPNKFWMVARNGNPEIMNTDMEEDRSPAEVVEFYIFWLGFMIAVSAVIVTSPAWVIRGLIVMAIGLVYFLIKLPDNSEAG